MECLACKDNLTAYLDEELSPEEQESVERHLGQCARCNAEYLSLAESFRLVESALEELPLSPNIWQHVHAGIAPTARPERKRWQESLAALFRTPTLAWASTSLGLFLLAGSMLVILRSQQVQSPELEALRGRLNVLIDQMEQHERVPHNFLHTTDDEYYFNPFAPEHRTINVNPFRTETRDTLYKPKETSGVTGLPVQVMPASERR
ncbi:MAG TPA: zf-HC2 domain-containing protein [Acidobacteriota bacterium]|jgi:hypothetical protein